MEELRAILSEHVKKYPQMEVQDAVKLIYQNEFGPGHLLADLNRAKSYLKQEAQETRFDGEDEEVFIGNGLVRLNVCGLNETEMDELVLKMEKTAKEHKGSLDLFIQKIDVLIQMKKEGYFLFSMDQLMRYLEEYSRQGYPMVSHSDSYRRKYKPHYRVIKSDFVR